MNTYDPKKRSQDKQAARDLDDTELAAGKITREQLSKRNGFFSSLDIINSKIVIKNK